MERSLYKLGESCVFRACALVGAAVIAVSATPQNAAAQTERWHAREFQTGVFGQDNAVDVAFWKDQSTNEEWVYMTGYHTTASGATVFATHKYAADDTGLATFAARAFYPPDPATATGTNRAVGIEVDEDGNVYVTGESSDPNGAEGLDYVIIKYDKFLDPDTTWDNNYPGAVVRWDNPTFGGATSHDRPVKLSLGSIPMGVFVKRNVIGVTGRSDGGPATQDDIVTVLWDATTGNRYTGWADVGWGVGVRSFDGTGHADDKPVDLDLHWKSPLPSLGPAGVPVLFVVVGGTTKSVNGAQINDDIYAIEYMPDGDVLWDDTYNGPANSDDVATAMTLSSTGGIFVCGYTRHYDPGQGASSGGGGGAAFVPDTDYIVIGYDDGNTFGGERWPDWEDAGPPNVQGVRIFNGEE